MELKETGADAGKDGLLIPVDSEVISYFRLRWNWIVIDTLYSVMPLNVFFVLKVVRAWQVEQCPHRAEIQGIALIPSSSKSMSEFFDL